MDLDVRMKAVMLGACFLIVSRALFSDTLRDFMILQEKPNIFMKKKKLFPGCNVLRKSQQPRERSSRHVLMMQHRTFQIQFSLMHINCKRNRTYNIKDTNKSGIRLITIKINKLLRNDEPSTELRLAGCAHLSMCISEMIHSSGEKRQYSPKCIAFSRYCVYWGSHTTNRNDWATSSDLWPHIQRTKIFSFEICLNHIYNKRLFNVTRSISRGSYF